MAKLSLFLPPTFCFLVPFLTTGCATTAPPSELIEARTAYQRASAGQALQLVPAEVQAAKVALDRAEKKFEEDGDAKESRDLAYVAQRRAQLAETKGTIAAASRTQSQAQQDLKTAETQNARRTAGELDRTREQLAKEQQQRMAAEQKAKDAMDTLVKFAAVKQESRGTVITLNGSVLFATGKSALLPTAQERLSEVVKALKEQENRAILVEGHTDSVGSEAANQELSRKRAEAVRDYLTGQGMPKDRVRAVGLGKDRPIADNTSAEGRANNRRVEIVVEPAAGGANGAAPSMGQTSPSNRSLPRLFSRFAVAAPKKINGDNLL